MNGLYRHNEIVWHELHSPDPEKSLVYLGEVLGWRAESRSSPDGERYHVLSSVDGVRLAGLVESPAPARWIPSISVPDVDALLPRAERAGAKLRGRPSHRADLGRAATLADPTGGIVNLWTSAERDPPSRPAAFGWEQLSSAHVRASTAFYSTLFGWTKTRMAGEPGERGMEAFHRGVVPLAFVSEPPVGVPTRWISYVVVDSLRDTLRRSSVYGGSISVEPIDLPSVGRVALVCDNVGAWLGLLEDPGGAA